MPLHELFRMAKTNSNSAQDLNPPCSSGQSSLPESGLCELVWENGQILMQDHLNTPKRAATSRSLPSQCLPSYSARGRHRQIGSSNPRTGKFGEFESVIDEIPMSVPSSDMDLHQNEDLVPWFNNAMDDTRQHGYNSELLPEFSVVTSNELPNHSNFSLVEKRSSCNYAFRNSSKNSANDGGDAILDNMSSRLYRSSLIQRQTSLTSLRSREPEIQNEESNGQHIHLFSNNLTQVRHTRGFSDFKMQSQDPELPSSSSTVMNFSHFARPAALLRNNLQSIGATCGLSSARTDSVASTAKDFTARSNHIPTSTPIESDNGNTNESTAQAIKQPSKVDLSTMESRPDQQRAPPVTQSEPVGQADAAKDEQACSQILVVNARKGVTDGEKSTEPAAASSVCSGNSVEKSSDDPIQHKKRKSRDNDGSECHSEDVEEEYVDVKKAASARGGPGSKRSRAAEVHNLSERRRRDRINEKMRALQELIPNCNKVDKASMLDEAIEYLKTLQLQVQMMSMGAGLYMPQMMFPTAMHHMASFSPMGVGMHMGFGMGYGMAMPDINGSSPAYPMMQMPTVQGTHLPTPPSSVQTGLHGMAGSNIQVFGYPSQGLPISTSHSPLVSEAPQMKSMELNAYEAEGPVCNMDSASGSGTKDSTVHMTSQVTLCNGANEELNQIPNQATPPAGYHDGRAQGVKDSGTCNTGKEDRAEPSYD